MINAATGQPDPCPMCGSTNVRWRGRRFYDGIFVFLRYTLDRVLGALFASGQATTVRRGPLGYEDQLATRKYRIERDRYEERVGNAVARRFWKCRACGQHGEDFGSLAADLASQRATLAAMEDDLRNVRVGGANQPIDRDGLARDTAQRSGPPDADR